MWSEIIDISKKFIEIFSLFEDIIKEIVFFWA